MRFSGSTMAYAMTTTLVISAMLTGIIFLNQSQRSVLNRRVFTERARDNLQSGMKLLLEQKDIHRREYQFQLFGSIQDSFRTRTEPWGLYWLMHSEGISRHHRVFRSSLTGCVPREPQLALDLGDSGVPLSLAGDSRLLGDVRLPSEGIVRGKVGSRRYSGQDLFRGRRLRQEGFPGRVMLSETVIRPLRNILRNLPQLPPGKNMMLLDGETMFQPWEGEIRHIRDQKTILLGDVRIKGKYMITSGDEIIVSGKAKLDHTVLIARKIIIGENFSGRIQAFATDTLEIRPGAHLRYPSVAGIVKVNDKPCYLHFDRQTILEGSVICISVEDNRIHDGDYALIESGSLVYGEVIIEQNLDLRGRVYGQVHTRNFELRAPSVRYRNYLLDAVIDPGELSPEFSGVIKDRNDLWKVIEWL